MKNVILFIILILPGLSAGENFGLGVILGSPSGVSGRLYLGKRSAIQAHAGWSILENRGFHAAGDYQFLFPGVIKNEQGRAIEDLMPYAGVGGRFLMQENNLGETKFHVGLRIGGGIEFFFSRFGIFLELYPVVDILPSTSPDLEGGLGFRFYW